jgi:hypothetical protein
MVKFFLLILGKGGPGDVNACAPIRTRLWQMTVMEEEMRGAAAVQEGDTRSRAPLTLK